eukprot:TRINITY_DN726_c0_g1_i1.p1 TRINITY_DN726_c0_g1~~TRINITY_DN726_c0_g1_i1.p1  ORF type:complete len:425 (+),score=94.63 TRINITY_DN726_c0_g1_i1:135-1409(+)
MNVLISGAGIAGPALGWFLAKKTGSRVTIVEKSDSLLAQGQNIDIQGSARKVIEAMGLTDQIRRQNTTEKGTQFIDAKGKPFAPFPLKRGTSGSFTSEFEILRGDLASILHKSTKDLPNVNYLFGTTIRQVVSNGKDKVEVELSDGNVQEYDLLVAADGQWSKVRKQCFPAESVGVVDKGMCVAYWTTPRVPSDNDWWNVYIGLQSRVITTRPDPYGTIRAMMSYMPNGDAEQQEWTNASRSDKRTQVEVLRKVFGDAGWESQRLLDSIDQASDFYFQLIQQIKMTKWSNSRVVCLGDAAYAPTPLTGMGTSLAITGAYVLAGELSKLKDGENPTKALEAFENAFRPFVEDTQKIPSFVPAIAHPGTAWKRWLLYAFVSSLSKTAAIVTATPWLSKKLKVSDETKDDDFPLPVYPSFENNTNKP